MVRERLDARVLQNSLVLYVQSKLKPRLKFCRKQKTTNNHQAYFKRNQAEFLKFENTIIR